MERIFLRIISLFVKIMGVYVLVSSYYVLLYFFMWEVDKTLKVWGLHTILAIIMFLIGCKIIMFAIAIWEYEEFRTCNSIAEFALKLIFAGYLIRICVINVIWNSFVSEDWRLMIFKISFFISAILISTKFLGDATCYLIENMPEEQ